MMFILVLLSLFIGDDINIRLASGRATVHYPGDNHSGTHKADGSAFKPSDDHIAHRKLPLGTSGYLCNLRTRRCTRTVVRDRGQFGALLPFSKAATGSESLKPHTWNGKTFYVKKIKWMKKLYWYQVQPGQLRAGWTYRGEFDLTVPVAKVIGHRAFDKVVFIYCSKYQFLPQS